MFLRAAAGSMRPWAPDTCHMPFRSRQMRRSGVNCNKLLSERAMDTPFLEREETFTPSFLTVYQILARLARRESCATSRRGPTDLLGGALPLFCRPGKAGEVPNGSA